MDFFFQVSNFILQSADFYGNKIRAYFAEADGRVFYYTGGLAVRKGDPLVAYGLESSVTMIG